MSHIWLENLVLYSSRDDVLLALVPKAVLLQEASIKSTQFSFVWGFE